MKFVQNVQKNKVGTLNPISIFGYKFAMTLLPIDEFLAGNWKIVVFISNLNFTRNSK